MAETKDLKSFQCGFESRASYLMVRKTPIKTLDFVYHAILNLPYLHENFCCTNPRCTCNDIRRIYIHSTAEEKNELITLMKRLIQQPNRKFINGIRRKILGMRMGVTLYNGCIDCCLSSNKRR